MSTRLGQGLTDSEVILIDGATCIEVERFNRTMADEFLYSFTFRSESERRRQLDRWVNDYNHHRNHTAVGGPGSYTEPSKAGSIPA